MKLLSYNKLIITLSLLVYLPNCGRFISGSLGNCSQYKYDSQKETWVDTFNQPVSCTLADNKRFFEYIPDQGCNFWKEQFQMNDTVDFREMVIRTGKSGSSIGRKYCVLQRYIARDKSGLVLLIDDGAFCFTEHSKIQNNYVFTTCKNVEKKDK